MSARRFSSISAAAIVLGAVAALAQTSDLATRGQALFFGKVVIEGKPRGHRDSFPAAVVRCANCHASGDLQLTGEVLTTPHQRRGGPPSAYTQATFCRLLHTGIDPASIMIDHAMPIYTLPDPDCSALWTYITRKESRDAPAAR